MRRDRGGSIRMVAAFDGADGSPTRQPTDVEETPAGRLC